MFLSHPKPSKTSELIGNPTAFKTAQAWANEWESGKRPPPLLVHGPTGIGKTALAFALASEFGWDIFEFNASDIRDEESVGKILANSASSSSLFGARRLILIDDADALSGRGDKGGAGAIAKVLSSSRQPIMLTASNLYDKKLSTIRQHCTSLPLRHIHPATLLSFLKKTAAAHKLTLSQMDIEKIAKASGGDVRAALNDLQGKNPIAMRDSEKGIFDVVRTILKSTKYSEARAAAFSSGTAHDSLKLWVAQNIPAEYERPFDIAEAYNMLSRADVFDGRIKRTQYWGYLRYSGDLMSAGVALAKVEPYHKYTPLSFPSYIREMGASKGSRAIRKSVLSKIGKACHCSLSQAASYLPMLSILVSKHNEEVAKLFSFEEGEIEFITGAGGKKAAKPRAARKTKAKSEKV